MVSLISFSEVLKIIILLTPNFSQITIYIGCCSVRTNAFYVCNLIFCVKLLVSSISVCLCVHQQADLISLGKVVLALACNSLAGIQRENLQKAMELVSINYSSDLKNLILWASLFLTLLFIAFIEYTETFCCLWFCPIICMHLIIHTLDLTFRLMHIFFWYFIQVSALRAKPSAQRK